MKTIALFLMIAGAAIAQTNEFSIPQGSLTLTQARNIALENNPGVKRSLRNIEAACATLQQVNSLKYPGITINGKYNRVDMDMQPDWAPDIRYNDSFNDYSIGINAQWLLFDGFSRRANILSSKYGVEQSETLHKDVQRLLLASVTTAYIQSQQAIESMIIASQDLSFNRQLENDSRKRYAAGTIPESELLNFSLRAIQAETLFIQSKNNYRIACLILAQLMALPDTELSDELKPKRYLDIPEATELTFKTEFEYAIKHRPDLLALDTQCRILESQVRAKKGNYSPKLALVGGSNYAGRDDMESVDIDNYDNYIGLVASWDLFSGGRHQGEVHQAAAQLEIAKETYRETYLHIKSSIQQALENTHTAFDIYQRSRQAHSLTKHIRDSVEKSYKAGVVSITRLNESQTDLTRSAGAAAFSRIKYFQALESLATETGRILN